MDCPIGTYRGYEITFDSENERFTYNLDPTSWREKQSYAACKKHIDDYLKANASFTPFKVRSTRSGKVYKIIGIRKDNRFIYENDKGEKDQLSDYNETDYILYQDEHESNYAQIAVYELEIDSLRNKIKEEHKKVNGTTLRDVKPKYIVP
jgi:hypothetical protein